MINIPKWQWSAGADQGKLSFNSECVLLSPAQMLHSSYLCGLCGHFFLDSHDKGNQKSPCPSLVECLFVFYSLFVFPFCYYSLPKGKFNHLS